MRFTNRRQAGLVLADHISAHQPIDPLILALPRGGVPVGYQVAASLRCDLDVLVVRKIGVPHQPELAMGAVSEGEVVVRNDRIVDASRIVEATFESLVERCPPSTERASSKCIGKGLHLSIRRVVCV